MKPDLIQAGQPVEQGGKSAGNRAAATWVLACGLLLGTGAGCARQESGVWQGYVEAEFLRVASPLPGTVQSLLVRRGDEVTNGQPLFVLERGADAAALAEAEGRLAQARSRLENLVKGQRPTEIATLEARREQARAARELARSEGERMGRLLRDGAVSQAEQDRAVTAREQAERRVEEVEAELATARLGGREDEVRAAEAEVVAAEAGVVRARWSVDQKERVAPEAGRVHDTLFNPGEWVPAGGPVVSLLSPGRVKVRFFVPEAEASRLRVGQGLAVVVDGVAAPEAGRLSYVASQVEYTPPVIYSQENRAKLVFMCEGVFVDGEAVGRRLHPGQPVAVRAVP